MLRTDNPMIYFNQIMAAYLFVAFILMIGACDVFFSERVYERSWKFQIGYMFGTVAGVAVWPVSVTVCMIVACVRLLK